MFDLRSVLRSSTLFADLGHRELDQVVEMARPAVFGNGDSVIQRGDQADPAMWVLVAGEVEVLAGNRRLATMGPGDFIGELAVLSDRPVGRSADVVARGDVRAMQFTRSALIEMLAANPVVALAMLAGLAERLRNATEQLSPPNQEDVERTAVLRTLGPIEYSLSETAEM